jgi:hypothetical protein
MLRTVRRCTKASKLAMRFEPVDLLLFSFSFLYNVIDGRWWRWTGNGERVTGSDTQQRSSGSGFSPTLEPIRVCILCTWTARPAGAPDLLLLNFNPDK